MSISKRIAKIRSEKQLSQADVARLLGMEQSNYSRMENRGSKMTLEQLENIAVALRVNLLELIRYETYSISYARLQQEKELLQQNLESTKQLLDAYKLAAEIAASKLKPAI